MWQLWTWFEGVEARLVGRLDTAPAKANIAKVSWSANTQVLGIMEEIANCLTQVLSGDLVLWRAGGWEGESLLAFSQAPLTFCSLHSGALMWFCVLHPPVEPLCLSAILRLCILVRMVTFRDTQTLPWRRSPCPPFLVIVMDTFPSLPLCDVFCICCHEWPRLQGLPTLPRGDGVLLAGRPVELSKASAPVTHALLLQEREECRADSNWRSRTQLWGSDGSLTCRLCC